METERLRYLLYLNSRPLTATQPRCLLATARFRSHREEFSSNLRIVRTTAERPLQPNTTKSWRWRQPCLAGTRRGSEVWVLISRPPAFACASASPNRDRQQHCNSQLPEGPARGSHSVSEPAQRTKKRKKKREKRERKAGVAVQERSDPVQHSR